MHKKRLKIPKTILGFELFDLIVIVIQLLMVLSIVDFASLVENQLFRLILTLCFIFSVLYLSGTAKYAHGAKIMSERHPSVEFIMLVGGSILGGLILALGVIGPTVGFIASFIGTTKDAVFNTWPSIIITIPLVFASIVFLPLLHSIAKSADPADPGLPLSHVQESVFRLVIITMSNFFLFYIYTAFAPSPNEDWLISFFTISFILVMFYVPVRIQDMFLNPEGPHLRSFIQTAILINIIHVVPLQMYSSSMF